MEFKCINCGATKESEKSCICATCGYKMFEAPFDRVETLKKEIKSFVAALRIAGPKVVSFDVFRNQSAVPTRVNKEDDDKRFPDFMKIQQYVCRSNKTEIFLEHLRRSVEQIEKHVHTPFKQTYQVIPKDVANQITLAEGNLKTVLEDLDLQIELSEPQIPKIELTYQELPNEKLLPVAEESFALLILLVDKIEKFIRQNNIYGTLYKKQPKRTYKSLEKSDFSNDIQKCNQLLTEILEKNFVVDIFSDGSDELNQMLKVLWYSIDLLMSVPLLEKTSVYTLDGESVVGEEQMRSAFLKRILQRYASVDEAIYAYDFLSDKSEEELFQLYSKVVAGDSRAMMGMNQEDPIGSGESEKKLNELIGLSEIKQSIKKIKAYALANRDSEELNIHMCFLGNPGSGKTEVARYIAGILYENKILPTKKVVEVDRAGLVSQYFGATAEKTTRVIESAMGGVLFIDEAYALGNNSDSGLTDYGKEAIDTLVKAMEDHRGKFCVILAGYKNEMLQMLSTNPGFKSRIQFMLDFPNYSRDELRSITKLMLDHRKYSIDEPAMEKILDITDVKRKEANFANAREIRNILDQVIMCQNMRCLGTDNKELALADVNQYIKDAKINLPTTGEGAQKQILTGDEELERLVGLDSVKRAVKKIRAYAKRNKGESGFNLHMCFYGNPGTGKTEVARILSRILYDAGVLTEAKLVETDAHGLLGKFVGETGPKTQGKINEAMGGVLFVDEAYGLVGGAGASGGATNYGEEAIAVLLKEMEDRRGQFCVILAGYKNEMREMLSANPGFESRIQFTLDFPDYSRDELRQIALMFLGKKKYLIRDDAMERILDIADYFRVRPNFANARTVRNILDQVLMNQNLRTEDCKGDNTVILADVEEYLADENIDLNTNPKKANSIGF